MLHGGGWGHTAQGHCVSRGVRVYSDSDPSFLQNPNIKSGVISLRKKRMNCSGSPENEELLV